MQLHRPAPFLHRNAVWARLLGIRITDLGVLLPAHDVDLHLAPIRARQRHVANRGGIVKLELNQVAGQKIAVHHRPAG